MPEAAAANQSARKRKTTKPRANVDGASWLVLMLDDIEVHTSAAALRKSGLPLSAIAAFLQKKYRLNDPKRGRPDKAFNAIRALILAENAIISDAGNA
jgi:hypothetical protein